VTQRSLVQFPAEMLLSNNPQQVVYTRSAQANSAFHHSGVSKCVAVSTWQYSQLKIVSCCQRTVWG